MSMLDGLEDEMDFRTLAEVPAGEEAVSLVMEPDGHAAFLPSSASRLPDWGRDALVLAQWNAREIVALRDDIEECVRVARDAGASWDLIGFATLMTGEAARKRWGSA